MRIDLNEHIQALQYTGQCGCSLRWRMGWVMGIVPTSLSGVQQHAHKPCESCMFCFVCRRANANGLYAVTNYHVSWPMALGKPQWSVTVNTASHCVHYPVYSKGGVLCSPSGAQQQHTNRVRVVCFVLCVMGLMRLVLVHTRYTVTTIVYQICMYVHSMVIWYTLAQVTIIQTFQRLYSSHRHQRKKV